MVINFMNLSKILIKNIKWIVVKNKLQFTALKVGNIILTVNIMRF